jgi:predicted transcriptional regulator
MVGLDTVLAFMLKRSRVFECPVAVRTGKKSHSTIITEKSRAAGLRRTVRTVSIFPARRRMGIRGIVPVSGRIILLLTAAGTSGRLSSDTFYELRKKYLNKRLSGMLDQMKIQNLTNIMSCLLSKREATKAELVQLTGLSNTTVSDSINSLLKKHLVISIGMKSSIGGRRATIYRLNPDYGFFAGIELHDRRMGLCVTDCENSTLQSRLVPLQEGVPVINSLLREISAITELYPKLLGIGIGINGKINIQEQVVIDSPENHWELVHLKEIIERQFLVYTAIDHRSNGATLEEGLLGAAQGRENYLCFYESSQTKLGIVIDNEMCRGKDNMTGQIQSVDVFFDHIEEYRLLFAPELMIIKYTSPGIRQKAQEAQEKLPELVKVAEEDDFNLAKGMAITAQKGWFKSIYFIM